VETLEAALAIKNDITAAQARISVQHLIDCDVSNVGCLGGWPARAWRFFQRSGFVEPESYPVKQYVGKKNKYCLSIRNR